MAASPQGCRPAVYARRRPEQTVLYRLVQQHLETYLALARGGEGDGHAVPGYVERELRRYLECGILAYGFARARCPECGHDFLVAFSCKGRGICPSCNARRMAETAAHLVDHVFPPLPVRQWVLSVPKRLRWYLEREPKAVTAVLHIFLRAVEAHLRKSCPGASARARFGAVSFVHRFGASLNRHIHYHCCILDGVFDPLEAGGVQFRQASALTPEAAAVIEEQVRRRVLHWFSRHGLLDPDDVRDMLTWDNSGFSLDASVCIAGHDRAGLERLLRYCARPPFALERIEQVSEDRIVYRLPEPQRDGRTALSLTPLELIDHLAALIPPPRLHRHRYHGVLYRLVQQHLETYLALARGGEGDGHAVPGYVERELRRYLECGILAYGFARARCPECGHDFLVAFSCKGRGICPSCNARRMAETAAHLVDHVFPPLPVRQWVLSVPKRLRWYLEREPKAVTAVLHIFLRAVEAHLRKSCPGASARARFGAVSFVHRFGASLNRHIHYHCCILDGVFDPLEAGGVQFRQASALTPEAAAVIEEQVRRRVLHWFSRHGLLDPDDVRDMLTWDNSGFSLDASVCIAGHDRAGLERLLRYCARPPFALERIEQVNEDRIVYRLPEPQRDGRTALSLTPLELIDHLAALIPPPRLHRHRYHGVLAPNAPLRLAATAYGCDAEPSHAPSPPDTAPPPAAAAPCGRSPAHYLWAMLLARLFASLPLVCPNCGADMRIVAFITGTGPVRRILNHIGEPTEPPRISPARGPPAWDDPPIDLGPDWEALAQPSPEYVFNQEVQW